MADIESFWSRAIIKARINPLEVVTGPDRESVLTPPAWSLDDETVTAALESKSTVLTSLETDHEDLPRVGALSILLWEDGTPAALLRTTDVSVYGPDELDGRAEVGDWAALRDSVSKGSRVVVERFRVIADNS